jgi:glutathione S-transferase
VPEVYGYLDSVAGDGFLAGAALSVAALALVSNLITVQYIGFALDRARFPRLAGLFDRVIRVPEVVEALKAEQPVVQQMGLKSEFLNAVLA